MRFLVGVFLLLALPAHAQQPCAPIEALAKMLEAEYRETLVGQGSQDRGLALHIYAAPHGSWTAILVREGVGCVVATGEEWKPAPPKARGA